MKTLDKVFGFISKQRTFVRSFYGETLLENFLISAVAALLIFRLFLRLTGYPQIGGRLFHIPHTLFGGIFMLFALFLLLGFLGRSIKELASIIGGIGFGVFIDELGKFITRDADYFFEPTVALIYIIFVLLFLSTRFILRRRTLTQRESLANAFEMAEEATFGELDAQDQKLALEFLDRSDEQDPLVANLRRMLFRVNPSPPHQPYFPLRVRQSFITFYQKIVTKWWFPVVIIGFFAFTSITTLYEVVALVEWSWALGLWLIGGVLILLVLLYSRRRQMRYLQVPSLTAIVVISIFMSWTIRVNLKNIPLTLIDYAQFIFPSIYGVLVVLGMAFMRRSRLEAYHIFQRAVLVSIFLTRVLAFYQEQFLALGGLFFDILVLLALRYMISREELKNRGSH